MITSWFTRLIKHEGLLAVPGQVTVADEESIRKALRQLTAEHRAHPMAPEELLRRRREIESDEDRDVRLANNAAEREASAQLRDRMRLAADAKRAEIAGEIRAERYESSRDEILTATTTGLRMWWPRTHFAGTSRFSGRRTRFDSFVDTLRVAGAATRAAFKRD